MYDLIIIGAGPAGITASIYAARKRMNFIVISKQIGGQTAWSGDIENYTGFQFISGPELVAKFENNLKQYNIPLKEGEEIDSVKQAEGFFEVKSSKGMYQSKTVLIATGKRSKELGVPGEKEYKNKGLFYCATCDGPLFSGKDVAVIGGGNSALDASIQLQRIASKVYVVDINPKLGGDAIMRDQVVNDPKVAVINNAKVLEIIGDKMVSGVKVLKTDTNETQILPVKGVFVEIGLIPSSEFIDIVQKNPRGEILVDCECKTSVPGIFAAGDVTNVKDKQIIIAAGEGSKAVLSAFRYLISGK